ncbi:MAG: hypothetical protein M1274_15515 [Actinobacteria bacterium]|nr:hypothetical protein [Actinomycetota bacterium]
MARTDQIISDLVLDIQGSDLTPEKFLTGVTAFFGLVRSVNQVTTVGQLVRWTVEVREGSTLVALKPQPGYAAADVEAISRTVAAGVETLETGQPIPENFPEPAVRHLRKLGGIVGRTTKDDTRVRVWIKHEPRPVSLKTVAHAADILGMHYEDYGSVEGKLQALSERGGLRFVVYEPLWDKAVYCRIGPELLQRALGAFGRRVEVYGVVQYRKDGLPVSVQVEELVEFPPEDQLPDHQSLRGILTLDQ